MNNLNTSLWKNVFMRKMPTKINTLLKSFQTSYLF